jgi:putative addiction module antidote
MTAIKLISVGNSVGALFPKELLARLGAKKGDLLHVSEAPDGEVRLAIRSPRVQRQIELGEEIMEEYRDTFAALAK